MKNTMKFLLAAFGAVVLYSCGGGGDEPDPGPGPISSELVGEWKLTAWSEDAEGVIAGGKLQVYLELKSDATFALYQMFNTPGFTVLTGSYVYNATDKTVSGTYSDGQAWSHKYDVSDLTTSSMKWTAEGSGDVSTYTKTTIPTDLVSDGTKAAMPDDAEVYYRL